MTMTTPEEQEPAVPRCAATGCEHEQAPGSQLCALDGRRLGDWLAQLGAEYDRLDAEPSMQGREVGTIGGTTLAAQRSVGSMHVMALRDPRRGTGHLGHDDPDPLGFDDTPSVYGTLAIYAADVREGRDLVLPVTHVAACRFACMHRACLLGIGHAVPVPLTVATERKLLATHLDWILGQDWAGEFHDAIRGLWEALRSANGQGVPGPRTRCRETVSGVPCPGTVRYADGEATCATCGTSTTGLDVVRRHSAGEAA